MAEKILLCESQNGKQVFYDPVDSHAATHFADTPGLQALAVEVLQHTSLEADQLGFDTDLGRVVGTTDIVEVDDTDEIVYAIRTKRFEQGLVPFTKSRAAEPSQHVSVSLVAEAVGAYSLSSAWIGTWEDIPFPGEPRATPESKAYWSKYAFVWGSQPIEPGTETRTKPSYW